ncbi:MFS transporter [Cytobacillus sp. IB215316]|uniref:MFS transporter n=1 Tax=Cytobacillus sp. IB215316 TaxID=3097354 RepID=UPI002A0AB9EE|nr:MFS transporter [Cytobacillus sp. IB215316]MDX8361537.1 MFS transporter [Cytobacillus sp. IB215316]
MRFSHHFYFYISSEATRLFSRVFYVMTITTFIFKTSGSATMAAMFPLIDVLSTLLAGFVAPLVMDKIRLKPLIFVSKGLNTIILLLILLTFTMFSHSIMTLLIFVFIRSFIDGLISPANSAMLPRIVLKNQLVKANGFLSITNQTLTVLGYTLRGFIVVKIGVVHSLQLTLFISLLSFFLFYFVKDEKEMITNHATKKSAFSSMSEGYLSLWKNPALRIITTMDILEGIANGVWIGANILVYVIEFLNKDEAWWGYISGSYYIGTILGGLFVVSFSKWVSHRLIASMIIGSFVVSIFTLIFGLTTNPFVPILLSIINGPAYQLRDISQQTLFQQNVEDKHLPKVFAAKGLLTSATLGISIGIMGVISDTFGVQYTFFIAASLYGISAVLALFIWRKNKQQLKAELT